MLTNLDAEETSRQDFRRILEAVRRRLPRPLYETWFHRVGLGRISGEELVVRVPNRFFQDWHGVKFADAWGQAASEVKGRRLGVRFEVAEEAASSEGAARVVRGDGAASTGPAAPVVREAPVLEAPRRTPEDRPRAPHAPLPPVPAATAGSPSPSRESAPAPRPPAPSDPMAALHPLQLQPHYTFEHFVIGPSNQLAHAAARAVADDPGRTYNPLFLYGAVGLGKTHLLQAICHEVLRRAPTFRIVYLSCEQFTNEFVSAVQRNATEAFRARFRNVDMLVIDDIHFLASKERTQEEFFHTFNALHQANKQVILSSDAPPTDIPTLEERLVSRFKWGLVEKLEQPETETRMAIIRRKAEVLALSLPDDVVEYIAANVRSNIREIEGAIQSVRSRSTIVGAPIDLALAKTALEPALRHEGTTITLDRITQVVSAHWTVKVSDLRSKKRTKSVSLPRQVVMFLARELTPLSLEEIGDHFGGRDHTTVLYAIGKVAERIRADEGFRLQVERLKDRLHAR
jgi:chromosomal replication initiator protein